LKPGKTHFVYKFVFLGVKNALKDMRTNVDLNDKLVEEALKLSKAKTKKEVLNAALENYVRQLKAKQLLGLFGKIKWEGDLDEMRSI
jgi:Arc/MetJ family transcription regulator